MQLAEILVDGLNSRGFITEDILNENKPQCPPPLVAGSSKTNNLPASDILCSVCIKVEDHAKDITKQWKKLSWYPFHFSFIIFVWSPWKFLESCTVQDPGLLRHHFLTVKWGEAGTQMESSLSRRFSNYTLETNQPEHCFLISRTKQWRMVWRAPEVTSPSAIPPGRLWKSLHPLRRLFTCWIKQTGCPVITGAPQHEE